MFIKSKHKFLLRHIIVLISVFISGFVSLSAQNNYAVNGSASSSGSNCFVLTQNLSGQNGAVWNTQLINLNFNFDFSFSLNLGSNPSGADGIAFVLQPTSTGVGGDGNSLGYGGISPSVDIEFDTYQNQDNRNDPAYDHISIQKNGNASHYSLNDFYYPGGTLAGPISANPSQLNIKDGQWHTARMTWDANTKTLKIFFDGLERISYSSDIVANIFNNNSIVYWGFTGATGGLSNLQQFCVTSLSYTAAPLQLSVTSSNVLAYGLNNGSGSVNISGGYTPYSILWSNGSTANSISNLSPGTYTVTVTDNSGASAQKFVTITQPPPPLIPPVISPTGSTNLCPGGSVGLNSSSAARTSLYFNNDSYIDAPGIPATALTNALSIEAWVKTDAPGAVQYVVSKGLNDQGEGQYGIVIANGVFQFHLWHNGGHAGTSSVSPINAGQWYHVAGTWDGVTTRIYVNGVLENSASLVGPIGANNDPLRIGKLGLTCCPYQFFGEVDEVRIWSRARTASEIATYKNLNASLSDPALVANYSFDEGSGFSAIDGAKGNTATFTNSPLYRNSTAPIDYYSYYWSPGGQNTKNITATAAGSYSVTVTDANGSSATSASVNVTVAPNATITASGPTTFCNGGSVMLTANAGASYSWSNGFTSQSITVTQSGNYSVTVSYSPGCQSISAAVPVSVTTPAIVCPQDIVITTEPSRLLANYPLQTDLADASGQLEPISTFGSSSPVAANGMLCINGNYPFTGYPNTQNAVTPNIPSLNEHDFSLMLSFKQSARSLSNMPVIIAGGSTRWFGLQIDPTGIVGIKYNNNLDSWSAFRVDPNQWYFAQLSYKNDTATIYMNGGLVYKQRIGSLTSGNNYVFTVSDGATSQVLNGCIKNLQIFNGSSAGCDAQVFYSSPVVVNNCSGAVVSQTGGLPSGSVFPAGITRNTFSITDNFGVTSACSFNVTVTDNQPPVVITKPVTINLVNGTAIVTAAAVNNGSNDNCGIASMTLSKSVFDCSNRGVNNVTLTVTDNAGNSSSAVAVVTVVDNSPPVPSALPVVNGQCSASVTPPTATDDCSGNITATTTDPLTYTVQGTFTVNWKYTDAAGNFTTQTQTVIVKDNTPPVIANCPGTITKDVDAGTCGAVVSFALPPLPPVADQQITSFNTGTLGSDQWQSFTAGKTGLLTQIDLFHNGSQATNFTLTIYSGSGTSGPVLFSKFYDFGTFASQWFGIGIPSGSQPTVTAGQTYTFRLQGNGLGFVAGPGGGTYFSNVYQFPPWRLNFISYVAVAVPGTSASDNCSTPTLTSNHQSGEVFPVGTTPVTFTATDAAGNTSSCSFNVVVTDNEKPVVKTKPVTVVLVNGVATITASSIDSASTDNCGIASRTLSKSSFNCSNKGQNTVTLTVTDTHGNSSSATAVVTVVDNSSPVPVTLSLPVITGQCSATVTAPTATDGCGGIITATTNNQLSYNTQGTFTINWTYTSANGNTTSQSQQVIISDNIPPAIPVLADVTGECSATATVPTTTDNCSGTITGTTSDPLSYSTQGTHIIHWTFTDTHNNTSNATQNVIVKDNTPPVRPVLADITGECSSTATVPTTTDNCAGVIQGTTGNALIYTTQGTHVITWTFRDGNGNTITAVQNVIVKDVTAPVAPVLPDIAGECSATVNIPVATDNCAGSVQGTTNDPRSYSSQGNYVIHWTFNDGNNNITTATQNVIIKDITPPAVPVLPDVTGECAATAAVPTAIDNCAGVITGTTTDALTYTTQGTHIITWTFNDGHGNISTATQNVIVKDITAPVPSVAVLPQLTIATIDTVTPPTATDNCTGNITAVTTDPVMYPQPGTYTITWKYNDGNGNSTIQLQTVIVKDMQPPTVGCLVPIVKNNDPGVCGAIVNYTLPLVSDDQSKIATVSEGGGDGTITFNTPLAYNVSSLDFITSGAYADIAHGHGINITVKTELYNPSTDSWIQVQSIQTGTGDYHFGGTHVNFSSISQVSKIRFTASQYIGAAFHFYQMDVHLNSVGLVQTAGLASGSVFPIGTTVNTFEATDSSGNKAVCSFSVTVKDTTRPVVVNAVGSTQNAGSTASWTGSGGSFTLSDNCSVPLTVTEAYFDKNGVKIMNDKVVVLNTGNHTIEEATFPLGTNTVKISATDTSGNISDIVSLQVKVTDVTPPVIACAENIILTNELHKCGAAVNITAATATDNAGTVTVTGARSDQLALTADYPVGTTVITWTATDESGNKSTCTQSIIVNDIEVPVLLNMPANIVRTNDAGVCGARISWSAVTATDNCAGVIITSNHQPGDLFPLGTTTVNYTATDAHNHSVTTSFTVTITDNEKPVINIPVSIIQTNDVGVCGAIVNWNTVTATDNCGVASLTSDIQPGHLFALGTTTVTYTATDSHNNTSTSSFAVTVTDNEAPKAIARPVTVTLVNGIATITAADINIGSTDNCGAVTLSASKTTFTCADAGANVVTLTVTDSHGNSSSATAVVTVIGQALTSSVLVTPESAVYTGGVATNIYLGYGPQSVTLTDNVTGGTSLTYSWSGNGTLSCTTCASPVFTATAAGLYTFTVTATNQYGCTTTSTVSICVRDIRVPNANGKVYVCHTDLLTGATTTLSISTSTVANQLTLNPQDKLGSCNMLPCGSSARTGNEPPVVAVPVKPLTGVPVQTVISQPKIGRAEEALSVKVSPNPSRSLFTLIVTTSKKTPVYVRIHDGAGRLVEGLDNVPVEAPFRMGGKLIAGIYFAKVMQGNERVVVKVIKQN
ncbi:MAG: hypothetical protein JWN76_2680 [Chitinophagaceae bacterium]|nr:hypothetical protein [Chitinophagaceae bacterium]